MQILDAKYIGNSASITVQFSGKKVVVEYGPISSTVGRQAHEFPIHR